MSRPDAHERRSTRRPTDSSDDARPCQPAPHAAGGQPYAKERGKNNFGICDTGVSGRKGRRDACTTNHFSRVTKPGRLDGFTLIELLVVIAIIGMLIAMMLPAITSTREAARRMQCSRNLANIALALSDYEQAFEAFPAGTTDARGPIRSEPRGMHHNWLARLLPYMDKPAAYRRLDFTASVYADANAPIREMVFAAVTCPSDPDTLKQRSSSYAGSHHDTETAINEDNNGVFLLNRSIGHDELVDGLSQTLLVGEKLSMADDLGWLSGTRATLRNAGTQPASGMYPDLGSTADEGADPWSSPTFVGGFGSFHPTMINVVLADGSVQSLSRKTDLKVIRELANRADAQPLSWP